MIAHSKILRDKTVQKMRRLPAPGEVLVKLGETVLENTVVARGHVRNPNLVEVRVDQKLGVDSYDVGGYLLKSEGDTVKKDEIIAIRRTFFGKSTKICRSPVDGTLEVFLKTTGKALIRGEPIETEVNAHIPGKVIKILPQEGVIIECFGSTMRGVFGVGGETRGKLLTLVDSPNEILLGNMIDKTYTKTVVVGGSLATLEALRKAASVGVAAVIVGGVDEKDLIELLGYELGFGVTGQEKIGFTLILTDGFGANPMNEEIFYSLHQCNGRLACVDGTTQIRARMLRPEIIVPS